MSSTVKTTTKPAPSAQSLRALAREVVGRSPSFHDCPPEVLDELVGLGHLQHLPRGAFAARRGDAHRQAWLVVQGIVESSALHADGHRHLVGLALPGDFVALKGVVDGRPEAHDLCARDEVVLMAFETQAFQALRLRRPALVLACERQMTYRFRIAVERLAADPATPLDERVAATLQMLAELYGRPEGGRVVFNVKLSQSDLADWLGLSRQRVNFALKQLEADGLIDLHYATLTITDPAGLAAKARI